MNRSGALIFFSLRLLHLLTSSATPFDYKFNRLCIISTLTSSATCASSFFNPSSSCVLYFFSSSVVDSILATILTINTQFISKLPCSMFTLFTKWLKVIRIRHRRWFCQLYELPLFIRIAIDPLILVKESTKRRNRKFSMEIFFFRIWREAKIPKPTNKPFTIYKTHDFLLRHLEGHSSHILFCCLLLFIFIAIDYSSFQLSRRPDLQCLSFSVTFIIFSLSLPVTTNVKCSKSNETIRRQL